MHYLSIDDSDIVFDGILDNPNLPVTFRFQRISKRKVNRSISTGVFVYLGGSTPETAKENEIVELNIMLRPVSVTLEKGGRLMVGPDGS